MARHTLPFAFCGAMVILFQPASANGQAPAKKAAPESVKGAGRFLRVQRDDQGQIQMLETSIVRYVPASGKGDITVDLVGAVHVGDASYYQTLNHILDDYDVVLYELVAPQGTRIPKGGRKNSDNPIAMIQQGMKTVLGLESQTDKIDYTREHFVHADLSPDEMGQKMRERGDDGVTLFLSVAADLLRQQNLQQQRRGNQPAPELDLDVLSLLTGEGSVQLKRVLAEQFASVDNLAAGLGSTLNTILITDRNQAAMKVFQKQMTQGKKRIAVFYGAAHMPDFEKRLQDDFGMKRQKERWVTAWDLKARKGGAGLGELLKLLDF